MKAIRGVRALVVALAVPAWAAAWAAGPVAQTAPGAAAPEARPAVGAGSAMDALLFYQLLIAEMELRNGRPRVAIEVLLDAGRRARDESVFERAVEIALQAQAGDPAVAAVRAWRATMPESLPALRYQVQILGALGRAAEAAEPVGTWLSRSPPAERPGILAALPRIFVRGNEAAAAARMIEQALQPHVAAPATREAALVAIGRSWLLAGDDDKALARAREAAQASTAPIGAALLGLELMGRRPAAEDLVRAQLQSAQAEPALRLAYARALIRQQRLAEAADQLGQVSRQQPDSAETWITLGAVELELRRPQQAEAALQRFLALAPQAAAGEDEAAQRVAQVRLMLAQAAEMRGDFAAAEAELAAVAGRASATDVQTRRAALLVRQGRWEQARELVRALPADTPTQARSRAVAEAQLLRDARQWALAHEVLSAEVARYPNDVDLLYELAMMAEKTGRLDEMERLLRRVMMIKPDHQHAYNALGYSLADRGLRLDEARELILKALALAPGDPFITDSLGWVEFRQGRHEEALRLLRQAFVARPDTEIAAHLGEVLWVLGQRDEARRIWEEGRQRDPENDVLRETLKRFAPGP